MSRLVRAAFAGLAMLLAITIFVPASDAHETPAYSNEDTTGATHTDWMASLPNQMPLSQLSIPGTHDSGAFTFGRETTETQAMDFAAQLNAGIRAWDIRLGRNEALICADEDELYVFHGISCQNHTFDDHVLKAADEFLDAHPGETILMRIRKEHGSMTNPEFAADVQADLDKFTSRIYTGTSNNPTLAEMRGKIVILQNFDGSDIGIPWGSLNIQDEYTVTTNWDLADKWGHVKNQFIAADTTSTMGTTYVNFLSASGGSFPYFIASGHSSWETGAPRLLTGWTRGVIDTCSTSDDCIPEYPSVNCALGTCSVAFEGVNIIAMNYINSSVAHRTGIVMADFPGDGLISAIINLNPWNLPPVADVGGPYMSTEATAITFDASGSTDDGNGNPLQYRWDFDGDGTSDTDWSLNPTASFTWWDDHTGNVFVEVTDGFMTSKAGIGVNVANVAPTITNAGMTVGQAFFVDVDLTATDPANANPDSELLDPLSTQLDCDGVEGYEVGPAGGLGSTCFLPLRAGDHTVGVTVIDDDGGTSNRYELYYTIEPTYLCANRWNGDLRMPRSADCSSAEQLISLPDDGWIIICASKWNQSGRFSPLGVCTSSEVAHEAIGDGYLPVCVNAWNGSLRVSDRCTATEYSETS